MATRGLASELALVRFAPEESSWHPRLQHPDHVELRATLLAGAARSPPAVLVGWKLVSQQPGVCLLLTSYQSSQQLLQNTLILDGTRLPLPCHLVASLVLAEAGVLK